ncbi:MAG: hypothetical protein BSOLF_1274 [Candidatus Carbobacillus altaicus]|uniref:Uncharacterized protein n=1 Tax=Candidatus Carbonibacillus altaicus TaxID=2163959 RepID=A0A2R6Y4F8_9BACL|nr:MAG: hypothetical protein BSOLF_1274 [Candidatus Carbobacillus altaicus]
MTSLSNRPPRYASPAENGASFLSQTGQFIVLFPGFATVMFVLLWSF